MKCALRTTLKSGVLAMLLTAAVITSAAAQSAETLGVMGMVNRSMRNAYRALDPNTSMEELARIQRHYSGWANRMQGFVTEQEMRNRLAQRYYAEQAYRQRIEAQQAADQARLQAEALLQWLRNNQ